MRVLEKIDELINDQVCQITMKALLGCTSFYVILNKTTMRKMIKEESMNTIKYSDNVSKMTYHTPWGDAHFIENIFMEDDEILVTVKHWEAPKPDAEPVLDFKAYQIKKVNNKNE